MSKKPLVSILIASFNKEMYVKRCIESCLSQSYKKIEIIFYDDGSKDNSLKIAKKYKKIKVLSNKKKKVFLNLILILKLIVIVKLLKNLKEKL